MTASEMQIAPPARDVVTGDPVVYVSPFSHPTNEYLENLRRGLVSVGCDVRNPAEIWNCRAWFQKKPKYVFLNWFEDRILKRQQKPRLVELVVFLYKLLAIRLQGIKVIWVRHNHRVHGQDVPEWFSDAVLGLMERMSAATVVHSERIADSNGWHYLPHPLYEPNDIVDEASSDLASRVAVLGQLRESKRLDAMLERWPADLPLFLGGKPVTPGYLEVLQAIIGERGLDVESVSRNLSKDEFEGALKHCKAVYVANPGNTMIVSGIFYHAASLGTPVILKESEFAREVTDNCSFAFMVNSPEEIPAILSEREVPDAESILAEAQTLYGSHTMSSQLAELFRSLP